MITFAKHLFTLFFLCFAMFLVLEAEDLKNNKFNTLTPQEKWVLEQKGTEAPFSGEYYDFFEKGTYHCKRCNAQLYRSTDKFRSGCGWPSFDDEIAGAIKRVPDADGRRTEIICANCGAHLGHIFFGEELTNKNTRHCVNSISLNFVPQEGSHKTKTAYFAGGCFWGVEFYFEKLKGVVSATSGYMGGTQQNPTYQDVIYRNTGHFEVVEVLYYPQEISYGELAKYFLEIHDPTQTDGQGPDIGYQYLSRIFYNTEAERQTAEDLLNTLREKGFDVATKLLPAKEFWEAEEYHQNYYARQRTLPYCHTHSKRFD